MARKCSICGRTGHNKATCPRKGSAAQTTPADLKWPKKDKDKKYPDYYYQNAPIWVANLEKANTQTKPKTEGATKKYCGNCKFLTRNRTLGDEAYCSKNAAAVRGHWYCPKWKNGTNQKVNLKEEGEDV